MPLTMPLLESFIFYAHVFRIARGHLKDVEVIRYTLKVIAPIKPLWYSSNDYLVFFAMIPLIGFSICSWNDFTDYIIHTYTLLHWVLIWLFNYLIISWVMYIVVHDNLDVWTTKNFKRIFFWRDKADNKWANANKISFKKNCVHREKKWRTKIDLSSNIFDWLENIRILIQLVFIAFSLLLKMIWVQNTLTRENKSLLYSLYWMYLKLSTCICTWVT